MNAAEAQELGSRLASLVEAGQLRQAHTLLAPILAERTRFPILERIGNAVGAVSLEAANAFLEVVASDRTEGGWVVIGAALRAQLGRDLAGAFARGYDFIVAADVWYGSDILGERVPGPALLNAFQPALELLAPWRADENRWVRRALGVAVHFWGKRTKGAANCGPEAEALLTFLEPMFSEWEMDAVKGIGWGLKTLGRHYPNLLTDWLTQQVVQRQRRHRSLMLRKALTYLSDEQKARARGEVP
jgi:3-methyladenine DNA glycosylase AlkD